MFDFGVGYSELFVLALVAVIVIGPKDLPRVLRGFGQMMNKARGYAREFQGQVDAAMRDVGAADLKKDFDKAKGAISSVMSAPNVISPLDQTVKAVGAKSFDSYFGAGAAPGGARVAGVLVEQDGPAP